MVTPTPDAKKPLKRRRCDNCSELFPRTRRWQRFCCAECKNEFHRHGSAFGPLKDKLTKLVRSLVQQMIEPVVKAEVEARVAEAERRIKTGVAAVDIALRTELGGTAGMKWVRNRGRSNS